MRWLYLAVVTVLMLVAPAIVPSIVPFLAAPRAFAVQVDEILADPALEARARVLSKELRCMVCQNQSIDDSDAPLARDLRLLVRERLQAGDSDRQVIDFLVARYGEFVLLKPRFTSHTALLWLGPAGLLLIGAFGLFLVARRYHIRASSAPAASERSELTAGEEARLAEILRRRDG
jgi:cytochrome c-type biogenesis protein CcmH